MAKAKKTVAKHAKVKRMPKSNKRMKHHFDDGGDVDVGASPLSQFDPSKLDMQAPKLGTVNYDGLSFGNAFALARKMGDKTFSWKGKSYGTQLASPNKTPAPVQALAPKVSAPVPAPAPQNFGSRLSNSGQQFTDADRAALIAQGQQALANQNKAQYRQFTDADRAALIAQGQQALANQNIAKAKALRNVNADTPPASPYTDADRQALIVQALQNAKSVPKQKSDTMYGMGYKKGGKVKKAEKVAKYAKGGHIKSKRGDGLATKGKTKGRVC
jgi:hypothetical protein